VLLAKEALVDQYHGSRFAADPARMCRQIKAMRPAWPKAACGPAGGVESARPSAVLAKPGVQPGAE